MKTKIKQPQLYRNGSALALIAVSLVILSILGVGLLTVAYGVRHQAIATKNKVAAMLAAEAGYEKAIFWMCQQEDLLTVLQQVDPPSGTISFGDSSCDYSISFYSFIGSRPVYKVVSIGQSGTFNRTVDVLVLQAIGGWEMGMCRIPTGPNKTSRVYFITGEIIDIPLHINNLNDSPDKRDINISGSPQFLQSIAMGESRYTDGGTDKYASVMGLFEGGICFDQPDSKVTDADAVQQKVNRFSDTTDSNFKFTPAANAPVTRPNAAVQLEFFVEDGIGKVRITNHCTVRGYQRPDYLSYQYDYKIDDSGSGDTYTKYDIYAYHLKPEDQSPITIPIEDTYVTQSFGGVESEPGGQIFVEGNVIIGGDNSLHGNNQQLKGKMTVVATGNIWVADSIKVDGERDGAMPASDNPNTLGLVAQGVIKVVDPGMPEQSDVDGGTPVEPENFEYVPVAQPDGGTLHSRKLPAEMEVEAAITGGGGGWGAENVGRIDGYKRKNTNVGSDYLVVRGAIIEAIRGIVGSSPNGYRKQYYLDKRLLQGILPGDVWLKSKYIPAPGGWRDY